MIFLAPEEVLTLFTSLIQILLNFIILRIIAKRQNFTSPGIMKGIKPCCIAPENPMKVLRYAIPKENITILPRIDAETIDRMDEIPNLCLNLFITYTAAINPIR